MPKVTEEVKQAASVCIVRIEEKLKPATREWIAGAIQTLLLHYYTKELPAWQYEAIAKDWIAVLCEFPQWAIEESRISFLRDFTRKPLPGDIAKLCRDAVSKDLAMLFQCKRIQRMPIETESEISEHDRELSKQRIAQLVKEAKKKYGM